MTEETFYTSGGSPEKIMEIFLRFYRKTEIASGGSPTDEANLLGARFATTSLAHGYF